MKLDTVAVSRVLDGVGGWFLPFVQSLGHFYRDIPHVRDDRDEPGSCEQGCYDVRVHLV